MFRPRRAILKEFQTVERELCRTLIVHKSHTSKKGYIFESNITSILITNIRVISIAYISLKVNIVCCTYSSRYELLCPNTGEEIISNEIPSIYKRGDPSGNVESGLGLRPLACWNRGFKPA